MHQAAAADAARYELSSGTYYRRILKTLVKLSDTPVVQTNQPYNDMTITGCCALPGNGKALYERFLKEEYGVRWNYKRKGNMRPPETERGDGRRSHFVVSEEDFPYFDRRSPRRK